jgi:cobalt-zinc-cadmium efflux system outer membrane protein
MILCRRQKLFLICLTGILWGCLVLSGIGWAQPLNHLPPDLKTYINEALQSNPDIKRLADLKKASQEAIRPAGALDDPMLTLGFFNLPTNTFAFNEVDMTQKGIGISQKFPFPGKRRLRSDIAEEQAKAEDFTLLDKLNETRAKVIQAYWGLALAYSSYEITEKNKNFWEQVVKVSETRYATGQAMQADVLQAQVEMGNYLDRLLQWRQQQDSLKAELNALRNRPPTTNINRPAALRPRQFTLKLNDVIQMLESRPQVKALKTQIDKQQKTVALARKDYYPDFNVGVDYGFRQNTPAGQYRPDFFTSYISLNVPLWFRSKQAPRLREEQARQSAAENAYQAAWNELSAAVKDRVNKLERLNQQIQLYVSGITPQAEQAAASSLTAYQVGSLEFTRLVQNQIAVYQTELKLQEYLKDFEQNWADLEILVGQELPRQPGGKL